jgi:hypothetical protein
MPAVLKLCCALDEFRSGSYSAIKFEVASYRTLYTTIELNLQRVMSDHYLREKLEAHWTRICVRRE